jgi:hypothetical protein
MPKSFLALSTPCQQTSLKPLSPRPAASVRTITFKVSACAQRSEKLFTAHLPDKAGKLIDQIIMQRTQRKAIEAKRKVKNK